MKGSKFSEAQIAFVLKQAEDGTAIGEVCRKAGISEATFYIRRRSASIKALSSSPATSTCGPIRRMWCSTSHGQASRLTTPSSSRSTASPARSA